MPTTVSPEPAELLRASGLRVTAPRCAVLDALAQGSHLDADTIARDVRAALGSVSTQTVYDVLAALTGAGLLRRIEPAGLPALYERRVDDNHHHLICRSCQQIRDIDCAVGEAPCIAVPAPHRAAGDPAGPGPGGFVVFEAEVVFWGLCPTCRDAIEHAAGPAPATIPSPALTAAGPPATRPGHGAPLLGTPATP